MSFYNVRVIKSLFVYTVMSVAIVTLKQGEEAELAVSELSGVPLLGCNVQISLYRGADNLLGVRDLPSTLCTDDAAFRTFAEAFGPVEKCFLMRFGNGLCIQHVFSHMTSVLLFNLLCHYVLCFHSVHIKNKIMNRIFNMRFVAEQFF